MANPIVEKMAEEKRKNSKFISLADGESVEGKIKEIKSITKQGFGGDEVEVIRLIMDVFVDDETGTMEKSFDNGSNSFINELIKHNVDKGMAIKISREGEQAKTKYHIAVLGEETA